MTYVFVSYVELDSQNAVIELLRSDVSAHQGRAGQLKSDLVVCRDEAARAAFSCLRHLSSRVLKGHPLARVFCKSVAFCKHTIRAYILSFFTCVLIYLSVVLNDLICY